MKKNNNITIFFIIIEFLILIAVLSLGIARTIQANMATPYVISVNTERSEFLFETPAPQEEVVDEPFIEEIADPEITEAPIINLSKYSEEVENIYANMTSVERLSQLFAVKLEDITGVPYVSVAGSVCQTAINDNKPGAVVLSSRNLLNQAATATNLTNLQSYSNTATGLDLIIFENLVESGKAINSLGDLAIVTDINSGEVEYGTPSGNDIDFGAFIISFTGANESAGNLAIEAINNGSSLVYVREGFSIALNIVLEAYDSGLISEDIVHDSVCNVLTYKLS